MFAQFIETMMGIWRKRQINRKASISYIVRWCIKYISDWVMFNLLTLLFTVVSCYAMNPLMSLKECTGYYLYCLICLAPFYLCVVLVAFIFKFLCNGTTQIFKNLLSFDVLLTLFIMVWITSDLIQSDGFMYYPIGLFLYNWGKIALTYMGIYCIFRLLYGAPDSFVDPNPSILSSGGIRISKGEILSELKNRDFID